MLDICIIPFTARRTSKQFGDERIFSIHNPSLPFPDEVTLPPEPLSKSGHKLTLQCTRQPFSMGTTSVGVGPFSFFDF